MSIFTKSNGEQAAPSTSYESANFKRVPEGDRLLCNVIGCQIVDNKERDSAKLAKQGKKLLEVQVKVVEGAYRGCTAKAKLFVFSEDDEIMDATIDKAMVYDMIAGGRLQKLAKHAKSLADLSDQQYNRAFTGLTVMATFGEYSFPAKNPDGTVQYNEDGTERHIKGNFIRGVSAPDEKVRVEDAHIMKQARNQPQAEVVPEYTISPHSGEFDYYDDDILF